MGTAGDEGHQALQGEFRFGDWLVQPELDLITRGGERRKLERKAMEVLLFLLAHPGEVLSVRALLQQVWAGRVVEENSVHRRISQLRKALDDDAHNPQYIASVPRRGYRTVAAVEALAAPLHNGAKPAAVVGPEQVAHQPPETGAQPPVQIVLLHRALLLADGRWPYLLLILLGALPQAAAFLSGHSWQPRTGYWMVMLWPALLPLSLWAARRIAAASGGAVGIPANTADTRYEAIKLRLDGVFTDPRLALGIAAVAMAGTVFLWLLRPASTAPAWVLASVFAAQLAQVYLVTAAAAYIAAFNRCFRNTVFLRSRPQAAGGTYVLDFDHADRRFGLRRLAPVFDLQILVILLAGVMLVLVRALGTPALSAQAWAAQLTCKFGFAFDACGELTRAAVFSPTAAPAPLLVACIWFGFFLYSMWSINIKLLPWEAKDERAGLVAYLQDFVPATSANAHYADDLMGTERLAEKFRAHDFFVIGDSRALDALRAGCFLFCLMLFPLLPSSLSQSLVLCAFAVLAMLAARGLQLLPQHLLSRVDRSLVGVRD